jgi:hypothetical protein
VIGHTAYQRLRGAGRRDWFQISPHFRQRQYVASPIDLLVVVMRVS